jgi:pimeloyl-ACP methyl ester carboxylesterase
MNTYVDDLAALIEILDLRDVTLVGHSSGGGEVARYIGRNTRPRSTPSCSGSPGSSPAPRAVAVAVGGTRKETYDADAHSG